MAAALNPDKSLDTIDIVRNTLGESKKDAPPASRVETMQHAIAIINVFFCPTELIRKPK